MRNDSFRASFQSLVEILLDGPGETAPSLRHAAADRSHAAELPAAVAAFADKVARAAHTVTDDDVAELLAKGYSEDAVFEITLSAALGAGASRLERGLQAMKTPSTPGHGGA